MDSLNYMHAYQVGDLVEIRAHIEVRDLDHGANILFVEDMLPFRGKIATIIECHDRRVGDSLGYYYRLDIDYGRRMWGESWLMPANIPNFNFEESEFSSLL